MAPLINYLEGEPRFDVKICVTAQHREMLDQVLSLFNLIPDYDLDIMQSGQTLGGITRRSLAGLEEIYITERPDIVLVHGDTTTTLAGALAAYYHEIAVAHVEAGLRTGDKYRPYPEEMNRHLTGVLADLHFAPTEKAGENLKAENIPADKIFITGNTVIDALLAVVNNRKRTPLERELKLVDEGARKQKELMQLLLQREQEELQPGPRDNPVLLVTAHRRENIGQPMEEICKALLRLNRKIRGLKIIFSVHLNPRVRNTITEMLAGTEGIYLIEPPGYGPFAHLMQNSDLILTDSGGIQEEAPALGKPVLVMREVTERPEAVEAGTARLVGTEANRIIDEVKELLENPAAYRKMSRAVNPYGDGLACRRIYQALLCFFDPGENRPENFDLKQQ